ncbi:MAG TPA: hypothetical protein VMJ10_28355 [Kofleriaceae bacterium]|nr:hypothetical protein [Kofleriaceae bacterium]
MADPPQTYVAKVKNILVGEAPTDAELKAVVADPSALTGLVQGWMQTPEYEAKMRVFFELQFQQTQIQVTDFIDLIPQKGLGNGLGAEPLVQNVRESFARTVIELIKEGRPLTDAFTTHRVMMTPALMSLYAYMDTRQVLDDGTTIVDSFASANKGLTITIETSKGPIPLANTLAVGDPNYMTWYFTDLPGFKYGGIPECSALDPVTFAVSSEDLFHLLFGALPPHKAADGKSCFEKTGAQADIQFSATDDFGGDAADNYAGWRMVTMRAPSSGESTTQFYNIPALRTGTELVLNTPHTGFFTTPAFFANWATNSSNQMRVTANQTMIVATGHAFDGGDDTTPGVNPIPGLDTTHAQPNTLCFNCHQLLDPMRSIFASNYGWYYGRQDDQAFSSQPGMFAFQGVVRQMATLDDFGALLAQHPMVPDAWAQKLCYYVNSAPCSEADPEYQRIVGDFTNGTSWPQLVLELMTSPITTNATQTVTWQTNGEVVAVSRRDHLCAALNNRLGFVDICQLDASIANRKPSTIAQIVSGLPSDGYGRGAVIPVLPNQPNLFYRAGLETICSNVAQETIDATPDPIQPSAKQWSSSQPQAAVDDFVAIVMGLPPSDPRASQANAILMDHFNQAVAAGNTSTAALQSTFVVACLSPTFIGIGM